MNNEPKTVTNALSRMRLPEPSYELRKQVLAEAEAEWALDDGGVMRARVLAAAETEWDASREDAPEHGDAVSLVVRSPLFWLVGAAAAAVVLVFSGGVLNERSLAHWQSDVRPKVAESATAKVAIREKTAAPALAVVGRTSSPRDLLQHLKRSRAFLENPKGDRI